jgi:hypothetical protein
MGGNFRTRRNPIVLKGLSGVVMIPNDHQFNVKRYRDYRYVSFKAIAQEPSDQESTGRVHEYTVGISIREAEFARFEKKVKPGRLFLLQNGSLSAYKQEGYKSSLYTVKVRAQDFILLKFKPDPTIGEEDE